jgi:hypothetical protein
MRTAGVVIFVMWSSILVSVAAGQDDRPGRCVAGVVVNSLGERVLDARVSVYTDPLNEYDGVDVREGAFALSVPVDVPAGFSIVAFSSQHIPSTLDRPKDVGEKCWNVGAIKLVRKNMRLPAHRRAERAAFFRIGSPTIRSLMLEDDRIALAELRRSAEEVVSVATPVQTVRYVKRTYVDACGQLQCVCEPVTVSECAYRTECRSIEDPELTQAIAEVESLVRDMEEALGIPSSPPVSRRSIGPRTYARPDFLWTTGGPNNEYSRILR